MDSQQNNIPDYDARLDALVRPRRRRAFTRLRILMGCVVGAALVLSLLKDFTREPPPQPPGTLRMRVLNTGGIGGYREEEPCLVDITAPFTKIGTLEGVDVLRYGAANAGVGFCPPGTLVQLSV